MAKKTLGTLGEGDYVAPQQQGLAYLDPAILAEIAQLYPQQQMGGIQFTQNDNAPGGFDPVAAMGSKAGNYGEVHTRGALRPNMMSPTEVWLNGRKARRIEINDNANFFGR